MNGHYKEHGYKKIKLYTTTDPNEVHAQKLYEDAGLKVYKINKDIPHKGIDTLFRELDL